MFLVDFEPCEVFGDSPAISSGEKSKVSAAHEG